MLGLGGLMPALVTIGLVQRRRLSEERRDFWFRVIDARRVGFHRRAIRADAAR
jgi:hypothetical protein